MMQSPDAELGLADREIGSGQRARFLGAERWAFADGSPATNLRLVDTKTATTGVVIATYQPVESAPV
jgi:hypothetical protein